MRISLQWLSEYVEIPENVEDILTGLGMNVEEVIEGQIEGKLLAGKIVQVRPHPNAKKLIVCTVDLGKEQRQIITGDLSVKEGDYVIVALPGAKLFNGAVIEEAEIRGVKSEGMMCSLQELGIEEQSLQVFRFENEISPGGDVIKLFSLDDKVLDIEITPNRGDLLSYIGVAREIAAKTKKELSVPEVVLKEGEVETSSLVEIEIEDADGCSRYAALVIRGVKVKESPVWLKRRLMASGIRPINNIVDATNYVMLETGHPIHAFDYRLIKSKKIVVRKARKGEKVLLLDEKEYTLKGIETLITDGGKEIIAVGGVMGAQSSGVNEETTDVLIEVAHFDPVRIRKTAKALGISSDASYRFERGVDPEDVPYVMRRVASLIQEIAGGTASKGMLDVVARRYEKIGVKLRREKISKILGIEVPDGEVEDILRRLGFTVAGDQEGWEVGIPGFRRYDVCREADLIEEIGRVYGYEKIVPERTKIWSGLGGLSDYQRFRRSLSEIMRGLGFDEVITFSFTSSKKVKFWKLKDVDSLLPLNPITDELDVMRESLVYTLMDVLSYNYTHQVRDVKVFEVGKIFWKDGEKPKEEECIGAIATGLENPEDYTDRRKVNFLRMKGILDEILERVGVQARFVRKSYEGFVPAATAAIVVENEEIGFIGMIDPDIARNCDVKSDVYYFEMSVEKLFKLRKRQPEYRPSPAFPSVRRDVALLITKEVESVRVMERIREVGGDLVEEVKILDVYKGEEIPQGTVSVTFSIVFRSKERTLKDEEVNDLLEKILKDLEGNLGVKRRF